MKQRTKKTFYCGTNNIVLPVPGKAFFPEEFQNKSRLHYYASLFNSLEVNSSFYKIPMARTIAKWAEDVPENFAFTFKLWRDITHNKGLVWSAGDIDRFFLSVNGVGDKKACILVQFPASIQFSFFSKMTHLLSTIRHHAAATSWRIAVEFRDKSWYRDEVFAFMETNQIGLVQHDMPASGISFPDIESDFIFLRFHGKEGDYKGTYSDGFLMEYAGIIDDWTKENKTVFAYFNNTMGEAVHNALDLQEFYKSI